MPYSFKKMEYQSLLIPNSDIDTDILNRAVVFFQTADPNDPNRQTINEILTNFMERPDSFKCSFAVINGDYHAYTKFIAFQLLKKYIQGNWNNFPDDEKSNIRDFILVNIMKMIDEGQFHYTISMADSALIEILKYDWPNNWPSFLQELSNVSTDAPKLTNAFVILKSLADDISTGSNITKERKEEMKTSFINEFGIIYNLLSRGFDGEFSQMSKDVVFAALDALTSFISIVDGITLMNTPLLQGISTLLPNNDFVFHVFSLFGKLCEEIKNLSPQLNENIPNIFQMSIEQIFHVYSGQINFNCADPSDLLMLTNSVYSFYHYFADIIDPLQSGHVVSIVLGWMCQITKEFDNDEDAVFPCVIQFWECVFSRFYKMMIRDKVTYPLFMLIYVQPLSGVIPILIEKIVPPYTIMVNQHNTKAEVNMSSYQSTLYDTFHKLLVFAFHLLKDQVSAAIMEQISLIQNGGWSIQTLNSISWTIGALSKALSPEENSHLMGIIIPIYLAIINQNKSGEIYEAAACGLLFLCSRESNYFRHSPDFLKSLVQQIYSYLLDDNSNVLNAVALYTFISLSKSCKQTFFAPIQDSNSTIYDVLNNFPVLLKKLMNKPFIQAGLMNSIGGIIILCPDNDEFNNLLNIFISPITELFMTEIKNCVTSNGNEPTITPENVKKILYFMEIIKELPDSLGGLSISFLMRIKDDLNQIYQVASTTALNLLSSENVNSQFLPSYIDLLNAILKVFYVTLTFSASNNRNIEAIIQQSFSFAENFNQIPPPIIPASILSLMGVIFLRFSNKIQSMMEGVYTTIFLPVVDIIRHDYDTLFDLRVEMLVFIRGLIRGAPQFVLDMNEESLEILLKTMNWLAHHPYHEISESAIERYYDLIKVFNPVNPSSTNSNLTFDENNISKISAFFTKYSLRFAVEMFELMSDPIYKFGFDKQTLVLINIFNIPNFAACLPALTQQVSAIFQIANMENFLMSLGQASNSINNFREIMKDFIIQAKHYSPKDPALCTLELFIQKRIEAVENENIPGLEIEIPKANVEEEVDIVNEIFSGMTF
ncbi:hypothetical protein TRFO_08546 [Tritrichomonas foetus]|uniref:Importin N-terminal domain-containing protein n=1 Tax=Tritrichomonas foetus TaxID=1144522 RepID=A0A1J4JP30_9EUKA|nr:hypothetical protein TRFO_08546 [Tritrichomonas foetus]|eukprot:OHS99277.1 hypothetical protein TRFO_08546 [Tritrichomonas foetus]